MTQTLTALFDDYDNAESAVARLERAGVPHDDISIVASNADDRHAAVGNGAATAAGAPLSSSPPSGSPRRSADWPASLRPKCWPAPRISPTCSGVAEDS